MRKIWIFVILALLVVGTVVTPFTAVYLWAIPLGEPELKLEFDPNPPWGPVESGKTLALSINIVNTAWLLAAAKHIHVAVSAPENFVFGNGTNEYNLYFDLLRGGERQNTTFNLTVPRIISSGNYTVTIRVLAENVPPQNLTAQVIVEKSIFIP